MLADSASRSDSRSASLASTSASKFSALPTNPGHPESSSDVDLRYVFVGDPRFARDNMDSIGTIFKSKSKIVHNFVNTGRMKF